jgi:putative glycosyltransferase (TIGR04372 family)
MIKVTPIRIFHGIITILHIPLLMIILIIRPLVKINFGYFSSGRIGHFALDLAFTIAQDKYRKKNEINLYYLQDKVCNTQLKIIAKRELNVNQYYKYFVYSYMLLGFTSQIVQPGRHTNGSRDTTGLMLNSKYNILLSNKENDTSESYMKSHGWKHTDKFVCLNVRDSAFFNEKVTSRHAYRNSNIADYEDTIKYLIDLGYWVIRMGKKVNSPIKIKHKKIIDYGMDPNRSDLLDIWLSKNCEFFISTSTGIDGVAIMFKKPIVIVNLLPIAHIYSWCNGITAPKKLFWSNGNQLTLTEYLNNAQSKKYKEKGIKIVNLSPLEIKDSVQEMIAHINKIPLTIKQIQNQEKFWDILENHDSYNKYHGIRNPNSKISASFIKNNSNFLV